ncbi:DUF6153 family protein [Pseudonocardia sp. GCM10023141]|uniref:DUF6153 family protein n=1 Tax=Pseudonocardia sp. GCM10023141 TaxID=3252653 RepID=UPI00361FBF0B
MGRAGSWRWERVLVVLALLLGVVAMHSLAMPMADEHAMPMASAAMTQDLHGHVMAGPVAPVDAVSAGMPDAMHPGPAQSPDAHTMMHLCLAVLGALLLLTVWVMTFVIRTRSVADAVPIRVRIAALWPRPPPPTSVRLAQLCVLRT